MTCNVQVETIAVEVLTFFRNERDREKKYQGLWMVPMVKLEYNQCSFYR